MIIRIYATESGASWSNRVLVWQSNSVDTTTNNGVYHPVAYDVKCSVEMGKIGTLKFVVPPDHPYYDLFAKKKTILTVTEDATNAGENGRNCLFRGAIKDIGCDIFKQKTITAESALAYLEDSLHIPTGKKKVKASRRANLQTAISDHNSQMNDEPEKKFTLGTVDSFQGLIDRSFEPVPGDTGAGGETGSEGDDGGSGGSGHSSSSSSSSPSSSEGEEYNDTSYTKTMDFINSHAINDCHGYLQVRYNSSFSTQYLDFIENYNNIASQRIRFAVNLEDLSFEDTSEDIYSVLVPVGKNAITIDGVGGSATRTVKYRDMAGAWKNLTVQISGKYLKIPSAIETYGYIYSPVSFSEKNTKDALLQEALDHISSTYRGDSFRANVKALDMHYLDDNTASIHLGDVVTVIKNYEGDQIKAVCSAIEYDFSAPENTEYTIGTANETLTRSSGGGGGSSGGGGGGGYGGAVGECIGYILDNRKIIDGEILEINTAVTNINSSIITLGGQMTALQQQISDQGNTITAINTDYLMFHDNIIASTTQLQIQYSDMNNNMSQIIQTATSITSTVEAMGTQMSQIEQTAESITATVTGLNAQFSQIVQTADSITSTVNAMNGRISTIEQTADSITSTVHGMENQMSQIVQTADSITSTVRTFDGRMSRIEQTVDSITSTVNGLDGQMSQIVQTADSITSTVNAMGGRMSTIEQTADSITSKVNGLDGQMSQIVQTVDSITSTVTGLDGQVSQIAQTADRITAQVFDSNGNSIIEQMSDHVNLFVNHFSEENGQLIATGFKINRNNLSFGVYTTGTNGHKELEAGVLVDMLSDGTTVTKIKSDYIDFDGKVTAEYISSKFTDAVALSIHHGSTEGRWTVNGDLYANEIVVEGARESVSLVSGGIATAIVGIGDYDGQHPVEYDGSTVKIWYKTVDGVGHTFSFNRPVSGSIDGSWNGNQFNVYVGGSSSSSWTETVGLQFTNPSANTHYVGVYYLSHASGHQPISLDSTRQQITLGNYGSTTSSVTTIQIQNASGSQISQTPELLLAVVVSNDDPYVYLRKKNSDNSWTTIARADNTYVAPQPAPTVNGVWNNSTGHYHVYLEGDSQHALLSTAVSMRWTRSGNNYVAEAFHTEGENIESIEVGRTTYKLGTYGSTTSSSTTVQIQQVSNSEQVFNTAELQLSLSIDQSYAYIRNNGANVARISNPYYGNGMADERLSVGVRFYNDQGGYCVQAYDTTQDQTHQPISIEYQYYQLGLAGSKSSSKVQVQKLNGDPWPNTPELSVGSLYIAGWNAAYGKVSIPTAENVSSMYTGVNTPPSDVDGDAVTTLFYVACDNDYVYIRKDNSVNGKILARRTNTAYAVGWNKGGDTAHVYYQTASAPSNVTPTELPYNTTYRFYAAYISASGADTSATGSDLADGYKPYVSRYFKTKPDHYLDISGSSIVRSTETTTTSYAITAQINSTNSNGTLLYNSSTHKYTARAGAYANGTLINSADVVYSGTEAYYEGRTYGGNNTWLSFAEISGGIPSTATSAQKATVSSGKTYKVNARYTRFTNLDGSSWESADATGSESAIRYFTVPKAYYLDISGSSIVRSTETTTTSYAITAQINSTNSNGTLLYNSSTHKYTARAGAYANGTLINSADVVYSGTEAYYEGRNYGGDHAWSDVSELSGSIPSDATSRQVFSVTAGKSYRFRVRHTHFTSLDGTSWEDATSTGSELDTRYFTVPKAYYLAISGGTNIVRSDSSTVTSYAISASVIANSSGTLNYNSTTHKYNAFARYYATPNGGSATLLGTTSTVPSGLEAYNDGINYGGNSAYVYYSSVTDTGDTTPISLVAGTKYKFYTMRVNSNGTHTTSDGSSLTDTYKQYVVRYFRTPSARVLGSWGTTQPTGNTASTANQAISITLQSTTDGTTTTHDTKFRYLKMVQDSSFDSNHKKSVYTRVSNEDWSSNGAAIMHVTVDASSVYTDGYNQGLANASNPYPTSATLTRSIVEEGSPPTYKGKLYYKNANGGYTAVGTTSTYWFYTTSSTLGGYSSKVVHF